MFGNDPNSIASEEERETSASPGGTWDAARVVAAIASGEEWGMEELYRMFSRGVRFYLTRQLGPQEIDDKVHDVFLIIVQAIKRGDLREPERLLGFVRTVVRRAVANHIDSAVQRKREELHEAESVVDTAQNPDESWLIQQQTEIAKKVLDGMASRDREILVRFYIDEQEQEQICRDMKLSETQFRLLKSRAKSRFMELGRSKLSRRPTRSLLGKGYSAS